MCEYSTKEVNENDFESHIKYFDIHYPLIERIKSHVDH